MKKILTCAAPVIMAAGLLTFPALPAQADDALRQEVEELKKIIQMQSQQLNNQARQLESFETKLNRTATPAARSGTANGVTSTAPMQIRKRGNAPEFSFDNGASTFNIHGRIQTDAAFFSDDGRELPSQADTRRIYIGARGKIQNDFGYSFVVNLANGPGGEKPAIQDAWLSYIGLDDWTFKIGNQMELYSLEQHVSNLNLSFVERSAVHDAFFSGRAIGATAKYHGGSWTAAVGAFGPGPNETNGSANDADDQELSVGGRLTYAPIQRDESLLHLGIAGRYARPDQSNDGFNYDARLGTRLSDGNYGADADLTGVDDAVTTALEAAYQFRNWTLQGEYMRVANTFNAAGTADADFDGWYAHVSWFPTGENRAYDPKKGSFKRVKPLKPLNEGGWGALEVAARYATVDLTDGTIQGGELDQTHIGVSWFPYSNVRFDANYVMNETTGANDPQVTNGEPDVFVMRAQVDF